MWLSCGRRAHLPFQNRGICFCFLESALDEIPIKRHKATSPKIALWPLWSSFPAGRRRSTYFRILAGVRNVSTTSLREPVERTFVLLVHEPRLARSRCQWATATEQIPRPTLSYRHAKRALRIQNILEQRGRSRAMESRCDQVVTLQIHIRDSIVVLSSQDTSQNQLRIFPQSPSGTAASVGGKAVLLPARCHAVGTHVFRSDVRGTRHFVCRSSVASAAVQCSASNVCT